METGAHRIRATRSGIENLDIALICLLEWIEFREFIQDLSAYPNLAHFVKVHANRPSIARTHPRLGAT